jgi:two-component system sensor histidine kinase QseC
LDTDLKLLAQALARTSSLNPTPDGIAAAAEHITALHLETADTAISPDELGWQVWHKDGRCRTLRQPGQPAGLPTRQPVHERAVRAPGWILLAAWDPAQQLYAVFAQSSQVTTRLLDWTFKGMLPTTLVIVATVFAALWLAMRLGLQPLAQLARQLSQRDPQETTELANAPPHVELAPMVHALVRCWPGCARCAPQSMAFCRRSPRAAHPAGSHQRTGACLDHGIVRWAARCRPASPARRRRTRCQCAGQAAHPGTHGPHGHSGPTGYRPAPDRPAALLRDTLAMQASRTALSQHTLDLDAPTEL